MSFDPATYHREHVARRARLFGPTMAEMAAMAARAEADRAEAEREVRQQALERRLAHAQVKAEQDRRREVASIPGPSRARAILLEVAEAYNLAPHDVVGHRRFPYLMPARRCLYARLRSELNWSLPQVGRFCGGRDHTTVLHGLRRAGAA